jgi:hypothetical protein
VQPQPEFAEASREPPEDQVKDGEFLVQPVQITLRGRSLQNLCVIAEAFGQVYDDTDATLSVIAHALQFGAEWFKKKPPVLETLSRFDAAFAGLEVKYNTKLPYEKIGSTSVDYLASLPRATMLAQASSSSSSSLSNIERSDDIQPGGHIEHHGGIEGDNCCLDSCLDRADGCDQVEEGDGTEVSHDVVPDFGMPGDLLKSFFGNRLND